MQKNERENIRSIHIKKKHINQYMAPTRESEIYQ